MWVRSLKWLIRLEFRPNDYVRLQELSMHRTPGSRNRLDYRAQLKERCRQGFFLIFLQYNNLCLRYHDLCRCSNATNFASNSATRLLCSSAFALILVNAFIVGNVTSVPIALTGDTIKSASYEYHNYYKRIFVLVIIVITKDSHAHAPATKVLVITKDSHALATRIAQRKYVDHCEIIETGHLEILWCVTRT